LFYYSFQWCVFVLSRIMERVSSGDKIEKQFEVISHKRFRDARVNYRQVDIAHADLPESELAIVMGVYKLCETLQEIAVEVLFAFGGKGDPQVAASESPHLGYNVLQQAFIEGGGLSRGQVGA